MPRRIQKKCVTCSTQSIEIAKEKECWNQLLCPSRRSHAKHRGRRNEIRKIRRAEVINNLDIPDKYFATLIIYRPKGELTPIHAIGIDIWHENKVFAKIETIHCAGLSKQDIYKYIEECLKLLKKDYQINKFISQVILDPSLCPIKNCYLKSYERD